MIRWGGGGHISGLIRSGGFFNRDGVIFRDVGTGLGRFESWFIGLIVGDIGGGRRLNGR